MAAEFIDAMFYANLALSAAILFVLVARGTVKRLFGPRLAYGLWLAVPLAGAASFLPAPVVHVPAMAAAATEMPVLLPLFMSSAALTAEAGLPPFEYGAALLLAVWVIGLIASALILAWRQKRFVDGLGDLRPRTKDGAALFVCATANRGPAVVGMFAPRIILPADFETRYDTDEQLVVLAHERAHLERGDALLNGFVALLRCLCWFNPLIHVAALYQRRDQEMACDATVVARHADKRRAYANALLKAQLAQDALPLGCHWPARSAHPLKARVASLAWSDRVPAMRWAGIAAVSISGLCAGYAAWAAQPPVVIFEAAEQAPADHAAVVTDRKPVPASGAVKSQIRLQVGQAGPIAKPASPVAMANSARLVAAAAVDQPVAAQSRRSDPWAGTPGRDEEQAGLRIWSRAAHPFFDNPSERNQGVAAYFKDHPDEAAERTQHYAEAVRLASAAVDRGDARAMYLLAGLYSNGWGVEQDEAKSFALILRAAEAGDTTPLGDWTASGQAMQELAFRYDIGISPGFSRDPAEAAKWYRRWARTVRPGTASALKVGRILQRLDTPEYRAGFFPAPEMPTLRGG